MADPEMDQWATHLPLLAAAVVATRGPVLELGAGIWSTPVLRALCAPTRRHLVTLEGKPEWLERFLPLAGPRHELRLVDWATWSPPAPAGGAARWGVAFVDHGLAPRGPAVAALRGLADVVVMHDSECGYCGYTPALATYDWAYTHTHSPCWTTAAGLGEPPAWLAELVPGYWGVPEPYRG